MRPKSTGLGQMGGSGSGNRRGGGGLRERGRGQSSLEGETLWYGGVWDGMVFASLQRLRGRWMLISLCPFWRTTCCPAWRKVEFLRNRYFFNRTMTQSTSQRRPRTGWKTTISLSLTGLQSPDLNPIEHLWDHAKNRLKEYPTPPKGVWQIWERVEEVWNNIPPELCQNLIESMPRRLEAVIKAKGGNTKY